LISLSISLWTAKSNPLWLNLHK